VSDRRVPRWQDEHSLVGVVHSTDEIIDWRWKGFPAQAAGMRVSAFVADRPSLFAAGFNWPIATLQASAVDHNVEVLANWCKERGVSHAPHGKTSMAPAIFARQIAAGAWAITAATPWQVRVFRACGVKRIVLANELVDAGFVQWLAAERAADPEFEVLCYVDSVAGVVILRDALDGMPNGAGQPLSVLVEVGVVGGRTGCRTPNDVRAVARAVAACRSLALVGVAGYEGPFGHDRDAATLEGVAAFVRLLADTLRELDGAALLDSRAPSYVLSCGGSGHIDVVTSVLSEPIGCSRPVRAVLRSGAYATHDDGLYAETSSMASDLRSSIEVWCQVLSRPEPGLALLSAGRRDVSFDSGMPIPTWRRPSSGGPLLRVHASISQLNDQHAFVDIDPSEPLDVGDLVALAISHPCTAHDKWQLLPLLDDERRVIDCVRSYF
jgi:D-serine deaminase-like pyridoxal phosphate-dependent protein